MEEEQIVESSMMTRIKYYFDTAILEIEFKKNGQIWHYFDFPEIFWHDFKVAGSHGTYWHVNIKNKYREARIG